MLKTMSVNASSISYYKIGGSLKNIVYPESESEVIEVLREHNSKNDSAAGLPVVIGLASNMLISDNGYEKPVISTIKLVKDIMIEGDEIVVAAGCLLNDLSLFAEEEGIAGFEWLSSLPGTIGGGIYMNARCYGSEMGDICLSVRCIDANGQINNIQSKSVFLGYKETIFKHKPAIITAARFRALKGDKVEIRDKSLANRMDRINKHMFDYPSCGCFFKNDIASGKPAGKLIDECGLKGIIVGNAQISPYHANFIFNLGKAKASDVLSLASLARDEVKRRFGILLEPEVCLLGFEGKDLFC